METVLSTPVEVGNPAPSGRDNLRRGLEGSFSKDLSSHYSSYVGMAAFRTLFHHLVPKRSEQIRLAQKIAGDWELLVRDSFQERLDALRTQYSKITSSDGSLSEVVDAAFEATLTSVKREIVESLLEGGSLPFKTGAK